MAQVGQVRHTNAVACGYNIDNEYDMKRPKQLILPLSLEEIVSYGADMSNSRNSNRALGVTYATALHYKCDVEKVAFEKRCDDGNASKRKSKLISNLTMALSSIKTPDKLISVNKNKRKLEISSQCLASEKDKEEITTPAVKKARPQLPNNGANTIASVDLPDADGDNDGEGGSYFFADIEDDDESSYTSSDEDYDDVDISTDQMIQILGSISDKRKLSFEVKCIGL